VTVIFKRLAPPRPNNMVEIVAESWMAVKTQSARMRNGTAGSILSDLLHFVRKSSPNPLPSYIPIFIIISQYKLAKHTVERPPSGILSLANMFLGDRSRSKTLLRETVEWYVS
jgi:hypothetical protein